MMEPKVSQEEKQRVLRKVERQQDDLFRRGRIIVATIAISYTITTILMDLGHFNPFVLWLRLCLACTLWWGVFWVRYLFLFFAALSSIEALFYFLACFDAPAPTLTWWLTTIFYALALTECILICIALPASKAVQEFFYVRNTRKRS